MGRPYEAFGDDGIAFIVELQATVIHRPHPGALDDPPLREDLETARRDLVHDLDRDVALPAVIDEGALEPGVAGRVGGTTPNQARDHRA